MSREIKFRAKLPENHWAISRYGQIVEDYCSTQLFESLGFWSEDDGVEYLQYTGLKDKNGKEIYERDKVKFYYKGEWVKCEIVYQGSGFKLKWSDGYINQYELNPERYEVIYE